MKLSITIKPNAKVSQIKKQEAHTWQIDIAAPAVDGKANTALIKFLAKHFSVPQSNVQILHGKNARQKLIEIHEE